MPKESFQTQYGPWAVVAGASEGLGESFARQIASQGIHVALIARRRELLVKLAADLQAQYNIQTRCLSLEAPIRERCTATMNES